MLQPAMPAPEPPVFCVDPANYCSFVNSFDALIPHNMSKLKRIFFLFWQCTSGSASALVKRCQYLPADLGHAEVCKLLQQTYVRKLSIAIACINSIIDGPALHQ